MKYELVGTTDDMNGAINTITHLRPVIEAVPDLLIPTVDSWDARHLRRLLQHEADYLTPLSIDGAELGEGEWIWAIGKTFHEAGREVPELATMLDEIDSRWKTAGGAVHLSWGSIEALRGLATSIYTIAKRAMFRELFSEIPDTLVLENAFTVLDNIHYVPRKTQALDSAIFLWQTHDHDRYQVLRESATIEGLFASVASFDEAVKAELGWHLEPREVKRAGPTTSMRPEEAPLLSTGVALLVGADAALGDILRSIAYQESIE